MAVPRVAMAVGWSKMAVPRVSMAVGWSKMAVQRVSMAVRGSKMAVPRVAMAVGGSKMADGCRWPFYIYLYVVKKWVLFNMHVDACSTVC